MTCNNVILAEPEAGASIDYRIPEGESARLSFGPQDMDGISLTQDGALKVSFVDGGSLTIVNFQALVDGGNLLYLSDGTMVDPVLLQSGLGSSFIKEANDNKVLIDRPAEGVIREITLEEGQDYVFTFGLNTPRKAVTTDDGQFVVSFDDGGQIVLTNYAEAMASANAPELSMSSKVCEVKNEELVAAIQDLVMAVPGEEVPADIEPAAGEEEEPQAEIRTSEIQKVAQIEPAAGENVAQTLAQVEPAAGESLANTGYGFASAPGDDPLNAPGAIGPLGQTALNYVAPEFFPEFTLLEEPPLPQDDRPNLVSPPGNVLDETNLGPLVGSGTVVVDFGNDGPGTIAPNGSFSVGGSLMGGALASGGVPVVVSPTATGYLGMAGGTIVFTFAINPSTGDYVYTQNEPFDHADASNPNDEIVLHFGIVATDSDGDAANTVVNVTVQDDAPIAHDDGNANVLSGGVASGNVTNNDELSEDDSNVVSSVRLNGTDYPVPNGGSTSILGQHGTLVIHSSGLYTYTAFNSSSNNSGVDAFVYTLRDFDGDTDTASISFTVRDDEPVLVQPAVEVVDETDLGPITETGFLQADFGADGPGTFAGTGVFTSGGSQLGGVLTSGGVPVVVTFNAGTGVYTGAAGGTTIFTLDVDSNGHYTFQLLGTLDHADPNDPNDIINLNFGVEAEDSDGDTDSGVLTVYVKDDVPTIGDSNGDVDETNLDGGPLVYSDTLITDFGQEIGSIGPDGGFEALDESSNPLALTSGGVPVVVTTTATGYVGTAGGTIVFSLTVNPATGQYVYTQNEELDHPDAGNPDDVILLKFGVEVESIDHDTAHAIIKIEVADDGPVAVDDINGAEEGQFITGDVVANDDLSEDHPNIVTQVVFGATTYPVPGGGSATITTSLGTLVMNSDGTYTYTATDIGDPDGTDVFTYTLRDDDGDSDTASLSIRVTPDGEPVAVSDTLAVDETNLTPGPMIFNEHLAVDFGIDGAGTITPSGTFTPGGSLMGGALTSGGVPVVVTTTATGYVGMAGAVTVFTLDIQNNGDYSFQLFDHIDHADATDPNDIITMDFGVTIADSDGDEAAGNILIHIHDDAPVAYDDGHQVVEESHSVSGNVRSNDELSEDRPTNVVEVVFNGVHHSVPLVGTVSVSGHYGTLVIGSDGAYTYTANNNDPDGIDNFTYVLEDYDGDRDTAEFSFCVTPDDEPVLVQPAVEVVDETDLGPITETGFLQADFGADGPGTFAGTGVFTSGGSQLGGVLTSGGVPVVVTFNAGTGVYTGAAGGTTIFTLDVDSNGHYTFQLLGTLDHADPNDPNDIINLNFGVEAEDSDGDTDSGVLTVYVKDDVPTIGDSNGDVDETNLDGGPLVYSDTLITDFGQEIGSIGPDGGFEALDESSNPLALTSGGVPVVVTTTATGYVGTAGGTIVFSLTVNPATGQYVYTQNEELDHPDAGNPDDVILLKFGVEVESIDHDTAHAIIKIEVADDGPVAVDDINGAEEGQFITGDVVANDDLSEDHPNIVTQVVFGATTYPVPGGGSATITTSLGTLVMNSDGTYTYTATDIGDPDGTDVFTYTLRDDDGDSDTASLSIRVTPDGEPVAVSDTLAVDETNLTPGPMIFNEHLAVDFGIDGAGTITPSGTFTPGGSLMGGALTSGGVPVVVTTTATGYVGMAGAVTVFTLDIQNNGDYSFQLFDHIDHADATDPNDIITMDFGVTIADSDGDEAAGNILIHIHDDAPVAYDDGHQVVEESHSVSGNVRSNDELSEDRPTNVVEVVFNGVHHSVPLVGTVSVSGHYGTLVIGSDGAYTYTANNNDPDGIDNFTYVLEDYDGDRDTAEFSFCVTPRDDEPIVVNAVETVDETNLNIVEPGTVNVNYGGDGPGTLSGNGLFSSGGSQLGGTLSHNGVAVSVTFNAGTNTYTGAAGGTTVFTLQVNADGTYSYQQFASLDHADASDPDDVITLNFGVTATDADGDTGTGSVIVNVRDDGPVAMDDSVNAAYGVRTSTINLLSNDVPGADNGDVKVTNFTVNGTTYDLTTAPGGVVTVDLGSPRSLEVHDDGTAIFHARGDTWTGWMSYWGEDSIDFTYTMRDSDGDTDVANAEMSAYYFYQTIGYDPLVLDLDGDGVELVGLEAGILFDMDNDVDLEQVGWVARDDALLALDRNGDGVINDQSELFGNTDVYADGFANLASYDSNNDGVIDARDAIWNDLIVWQDVNADGVSDSAEMYTLAQMGIASISLSAADVDYTLAGNWVSHESTFTYEDGTVGQIVDAWFQIQEIESDKNQIEVLGDATAYGEVGADNFLIQAIGDAANRIVDFNAVEGDSLDLSLVLEGHDGVTEAINEFVYAREEGGDTVISVDVSGSGDAANAVDVARLEDVGDLDIVEMVNDGNIIV
ncbi:MAG: type I secretion C-terminal target domain-containing protein [Rhodospirillales bacterium]|nr:MAG: type I secretion C-terminal target domain-containing protein [Rhodospirillales bacterium]